jgi:hypothetical protein
MKISKDKTMHFILYSFSIFIYTVGVFVAGLFLGQWLERAWIADQNNLVRRMAAHKNPVKPWDR